MLSLISPPGLERFFEAVVDEGEAKLMANPDRLITLAVPFGTEILGEYPRLMTGGLARRTATMETPAR